ncbi:cation diffusion facilitator family transporter [Sulfurimonas indica]|uniref:cation diffusion facilitator family transporter n=1 Tax=Sulfurimonas indica TaxID=2508707 RepID=UPI001264B9FF|nr:cation diffusion facilitator family transporter [Sulfurimonas indica]
MSSHNHHHHAVSGRNLFITIVLNIIITLSQIIGGIFSGSLALLSDAMHNFSDVLTLLIAWLANRLAQKSSTQNRTFGYKRAEILATLFNASVLIVIGVFLIVEVFQKFYHPEAINSLYVIWLGVLSIVLNSVSVLLVKDDAHTNMNIKAAYLHLLTDVMTSVAVVGGGLLMYYYDLFWLDPLVSLLIALYLISASFKLVKESVSILMQFTPSSIDVQELIAMIKSLDAIDNVHHIHLWRLNDHDIHAEAHLDFTENVTLEKASQIIDILEEKLADTFGINHVIFQCEYNRDDNKAEIV